MLVLAWLLSLALVSFATWHYRRTVDKLAEMVAKFKPKEQPAQPKSALVDLDDPIVMARIEHEARMRQLNPEYYRAEKP